MISRSVKWIIKDKRKRRRKRRMSKRRRRLQRADAWMKNQTLSWFLMFTEADGKKHILYAFKNLTHTHTQLCAEISNIHLFVWWPLILALFVTETRQNWIISFDCQWKVLIMMRGVFSITSCRKWVGLLCSLIETTTEEKNSKVQEQEDGETLHWQSRYKACCLAVCSLTHRNSLQIGKGLVIETKPPLWVSNTHTDTHTFASHRVPEEYKKKKKLTEKNKGAPSVRAENQLNWTTETGKTVQSLRLVPQQWKNSFFKNDCFTSCRFTCPSLLFASLTAGSTLKPALCYNLLPI